MLPNRLGAAQHESVRSLTRSWQDTKVSLNLTGTKEEKEATLDRESPSGTKANMPSWGKQVLHSQLKTAFTFPPMHIDSEASCILPWAKRLVCLLARLSALMLG